MTSNDLISGRYFWLQQVNPCLQACDWSIVLLHTLLEIPISPHELLVQGRNVRGRRFPFSWSFPGPRRSVLSWPRCPWSCGRSPWRSLPTLRNTSSRGTSHRSVACWAILLRLEGILFQVLPLAAPLSPVARRLVATLRNGSDPVTKSEVCVCAAALHLSRVDWMNFDRLILFGVVMPHAHPCPPEGRVRSDTADNLRTDGSMFRVSLITFWMTFHRLCMVQPQAN